MLTGGSSPDLLCNVPGQSVGEKPEGTRASSHSFGYICSALRREGLAADKVILKASTFLRSLNLFLELRIWTVPRSLAADQPGRTGEQGTDGPELSEFHPSTHRLGGQAKRGDRLALQNFVRGLVYESVNGPLAHLCAPLCGTENSIRVDPVSESPNVGDDDLAVLPLAGPVVSPLKSKSGLEAENAALRHQLIILRRKVHAPKVVVDDDDSVDIEALFADSIIDERTTKLTIDMQGEEIQLELWSLKCNKTVRFDGGGYNFAMDSLQISTIGTLSAYMPPSVAGTVCSLVGESRPVLSSI